MSETPTTPAPPPPHLDLGNLLEIAQWLAAFIAAAAASGVIGTVAGDAASDTLKALRRRFGRARVTELEELVYRELRNVKRKPNVSDRDLRNRVEQLFRDYESR